MVGEDLIITAGSVTNDMKVTHKKDDAILGVNDKPVIFDNEKMLMAVKGEIAHGDDNFGSGVFFVTDRRVAFMGKGSIEGLISAVSRAAGGGRTFFIFPIDQIAGAEQGGMIIKNCTVLVKTKGFFGGDKIDKYKVVLNSDYKQHLGEVIAKVNEACKGK